MIQLGVATVHFQYRKLDGAEVRRLAVSLFDYAEGEVRQRLNLNHPSVIIEIEEGSLKVRTKIVAGAIAVSTFLANYGSVREGAFALYHDVNAVGKLLIEQIPERLGAGPGSLISTHRSATLTRRIDKIVRELERGEINSDEAVSRLVRLLDPDQNGVVVQPVMVESIKRDLATVMAGSNVVSRTRSLSEQIPTLPTEEYSSWQEESELPALSTQLSDRPRRIRVEREQGTEGKVRVIEE